MMINLYSYLKDVEHLRLYKKVKKVLTCENKFGRLNKSKQVKNFEN